MSLYDRERGFKSPGRHCWAFYTSWLFSTLTHTHAHNSMRERMNIHDKCIILTLTHTHTPLNPVDYSLGNYGRDFCCLSFCLALSSPPLLSLPSLVNSPTWPRLPIQSFDEALSAICLAKHKCISE